MDFLSRIRVDLTDFTDFMEHWIYNRLSTPRAMNTYFQLFFIGIGSVAFFFSAVSTQGPARKANKKGAENADNADSEDDCISPSQVSSNSSQTWLSEHPSIVNKKLRPCISYWIAITTPNGAPANPIIVHRALLECGVETIANQVHASYMYIFNVYESL